MSWDGSTPAASCQLNTGRRSRNNLRCRRKSLPGERSVHGTESLFPRDQDFIQTNPGQDPLKPRFTPDGFKRRIDPHIDAMEWPPLKDIFQFVERALGVAYFHSQGCAIIAVLYQGQPLGRLG